MPGVMVVSVKIPRPAVGSDLSWFSPRTSEIRAVVVSTCASSPTTLTVSVISPTSRAKFRFVADWAVTSMRLFSMALNPGCSIRTWYMPPSRSGTR